MSVKEDLCIVEGNRARSHDAGIAVYDDGIIVALSGERVDRFKHSADPGPVYDYLSQRLGLKNRKNLHDFFANPDLGKSINHPLAHAASAFYPSPFEEAAVLVVDGQGPYDQNQVVSLTVFTGSGNRIEEVEAFPETGGFCSRSLGHFYSAITYYLGFDFYDQGKTMALAAYGHDPRFLREIGRLCPSSKGFSRDAEDFIRTIFFKTQSGYFPYFPRPDSFEERIQEYSNMFGPIREGGLAVSIDNIDLAFAGQRALEDALVELCQEIQKRTGLDSLCFAGGVALNVAANSRIVRESGFKRIFIQPAAGDDGQALGRLLVRMHQQFSIPRRQMKNAYLGPLYSDHEIESALKSASDRLDVARYSEGDLLDETVSRLTNGKVVAWFQGRSELGPRALGHRSILADPRNQDMQERLNCFVKHREWFRPFGLSIVREKANQYFDIADESPYMLIAVPALRAGHNAMPSGIHVDSSSRLQTLTPDENDLFFKLVSRFDQVTGVPALVNTSFNDKKQPIVETPEDAVTSFLAMEGIDSLVIGSYIAQRTMSHK